MARGTHKCDYRKFIKAYNSFVVEGKTLTEAQKICGIGKATMIKYFNMVLLNEPIPPGVFFDENGRLYTKKELKEDEERRKRGAWRKENKKKKKKSQQQ